MSLSLEYFRQRELNKQGILPTPPDTHKFLAENMQKYPKDAKIVTYCNANCSASAALLFSLKKLGFTNVRSMDEGIQVWQAKGFPVAGDTTMLAKSSH